MDFSDQRQSYDKGVLSSTSVPNNPFDLLKAWIAAAIDNKAPEPYAMSLATCGNDKMPAVRTVLMREITETGLVFYTNYLSAKGVDIAQNPLAETLFFWHDMQRQIRIRGTVHKIDQSKTDAYFQKRPYESQIGAWVSQPQSGVVESRAKMDDLFATFKQKYPEGSTVPTPDFWGGYELVAEEIEFWQGRPNRQHDRVLYSLLLEGFTESNQLWTIKRLLP